MGGGGNPWGNPAPPQNRYSHQNSMTNNFTDPNDIAQVMGMDEFYDPAIKGVQTSSSSKPQAKAAPKKQPQQQAPPQNRAPVKKSASDEWKQAGKGGKTSKPAQKESPVPEGDQLAKWAILSLKKLKTAPSGIDVPTFVELIRAIDSPWELKDITMNYFGETKEAKNFANVFIEKRIEIKKLAEQEAARRRDIEKAKTQLERRKRAQEEAIQKRKQELENIARKTSADSDGGKNSGPGNTGINSQVGNFFSQF